MQNDSKISTGFSNQSLYINMKRLSIFCAFALLGLWYPLHSTAQSQALQQLRLDIEKLAQLKIMLNNMYSGYAMLSKGYDNIREQAQAGFKLHKGFIDGLSAVSPAVKNSAMVAAILSLQSQIKQEYAGTINEIRQAGVFSTKELTDLGAAYETILARTAKNIDGLAQVTTAGRMQMSEAERICFLESLVDDMEKQLAALRNFTAQAKGLKALRQRLKKDNQQLREQYGIVK